MRWNEKEEWERWSLSAAKKLNMIYASVFIGNDKLFVKWKGMNEIRNKDVWNKCEWQDQNQVKYRIK